MIRVMIADDHPIVREGLKRIIASRPNMTLVAEATNGDEAFGKCMEDAVDVLLLDICMPGLGFLDLIKRLRNSRPAVRVIVLSAHAEKVFAVRAFRAGAAGYVAKERSSEELAAAIRHVYQGKSYITVSVAEKLAAALCSGPIREPHEALSVREYEVFGHLAAGMRIKDIAATMALSPKTVSTYRTRVFQKMGFRSNAELVRYAIENELIGVRAFPR